MRQVELVGRPAGESSSGQDDTGRQQTDGRYLGSAADALPYRRLQTCRVPPRLNIELSHALRLVTPRLKSGLTLAHTPLDLLRSGLETGLVQASRLVLPSVKTGLIQALGLSHAGHKTRLSQASRLAYP